MLLISSNIDKLTASSSQRTGNNFLDENAKMFVTVPVPTTSYAQPKTLSASFNRDKFWRPCFVFICGDIVTLYSALQHVERTGSHPVYTLIYSKPLRRPPKYKAEPRPLRAQVYLFRSRAFLYDGQLTQPAVHAIARSCRKHVQPIVLDPVNRFIQTLHNILSKSVLGRIHSADSFTVSIRIIQRVLALTWTLLLSLSEQLLLPLSR